MHPGFSLVSAGLSLWSANSAVLQEQGFAARHSVHNWEAIGYVRNLDIRDTGSRTETVAGIATGNSWRAGIGIQSSRLDSAGNDRPVLSQSRALALISISDRALVFMGSGYWNLSLNQSLSLPGGAGIRVSCQGVSVPGAMDRISCALGFNLVQEMPLELITGWRQDIRSAFWGIQYRSHIVFSFLIRPDNTAEGVTSIEWGLSYPLSAHRSEVLQTFRLPEEVPEGKPAEHRKVRIRLPFITVQRWGVSLPSAALIDSGTDLCELPDKDRKILKRHGWTCDPE